MVVTYRKLSAFGGNMDADLVSLFAARGHHVMIMENLSTHVCASMVVSSQAASPQINFHLFCHLVYHLAKTTK